MCDGIEVHWGTKEDEHAESVVRAGVQWPDRWPTRHLHWPAPKLPDPKWRPTPLVAEIDGRVVGRASVEAIYPPFGQLVNMIVLPQFRGRGAGGALVDECTSYLGRKGFLAVFLQTNLKNPSAHRLYARKGFVVAARGVMLRLIRFISLPILDAFLHEYPLALYQVATDGGEREWPLVWSDWVTGDTLRITLTGGSSDKDSDDYGPGIRAADVRGLGMDLSAQLTGPGKAARKETVQLGLELSNRADTSLDMTARLLLPPGCNPCGQWAEKGPATALEPGQALKTVFELSFGPELDLEAPRYSDFTSTPLTVEVFVGGTCFWLSHSLQVKED